MNTVIFATSNEGKMREVRAILADMPVRVLSMKEAGIKVDVEENGTSFEENALIKASGIADCIPELLENLMLMARLPAILHLMAATKKNIHTTKMVM